MFEQIGGRPDAVAPREQGARQFQPDTQLGRVFDQHSAERANCEVVVVLDFRIRVLDALLDGPISRGESCQSGSKGRLVGVGPRLSHWPDQRQGLCSPAHVEQPLRSCEGCRELLVGGSVGWRVGSVRDGREPKQRQDGYECG